MARGKYAVKAASNRAETAGLRAEHLKRDLDVERARHAADVAELKARVEHLSAQLTGAVTGLAADEVRRVETKCAEQLRAERDRHRQAGLEVFRRIGRSITFDAPGNAWHIPDSKIPELVGELAQVLGIPPGEAQEAGAREAGVTTDRATRRADAKKYKASVTGQQYVVLRGIR